MFFQTCSRTHSDFLLVVDSPQSWGMVSCSWLSLSDLSTLMLSHWKRIGSLGIIPLFYSDLLFQCVFDLFIQDSVPIPVNIFFGLTELSEFFGEPRFVLVIS